MAAALVGHKTKRAILFPGVEKTFEPAGADAKTPHAFMLPRMPFDISENNTGAFDYQPAHRQRLLQRYLLGE